ncbi:MAG TPA: glutamine amidotransferase [Oxalicibacterium sp.]|nr:glutamine amidotransferase [Oxalicibacterium sp.]
MKTLVIFKAGSTFADLARAHGDFEDWITRGVGDALSITVVDARKAAALPQLDNTAAAIVTGSHAMVTDRAPWSERLAAWLSDAHRQEIPLLGICYGHQLLADALGGEVAYHSQGMEIGSVAIDKTPAAASDPLFADLPEHFMGNVVHSQSVRSLPPEATLLARNAFDPHQAFRVGRHSWGVQFHPEFDEKTMRAYFDRMGEDLASRGIDAGAKRREVVPTAAAASVLLRFASLAAARNKQA